MFPADEVRNLGVVLESSFSHLNTAMTLPSKCLLNPALSALQFSFSSSLNQNTFISPAFPFANFHVLFLSPLSFATVDLWICFLFPQFFCILMSMLTLVPLPEWPSVSLFCFGAPVWQTSAWPSILPKSLSWPIISSPPFRRIAFSSLCWIASESL